MISIHTDRLSIIESYDVDMAIVGWLNDKDLMRWSEQRHRSHDEDTQRHFLDHAYGNSLRQDHGNPLVFNIQAALDTEDDIDIFTVGSIHAHIDERNKRADMGVLIGPPYRGRRYAQEAWSEVERVLVEEFGIKKFEAGCMGGNKPMQYILKNLHYRVEGVRKGHFELDADGRRQNLVLYGKVAP